MNHFKKLAAVNIYGPMYLAGTTGDALRSAIEADEKKYTAEEVTEILAAAALYQADGAGSGPKEPENKGKGKTKTQSVAKSIKNTVAGLPLPDPTKTKNLIYEEWEVNVEREDIKDGLGKVIGTKVKDYNPIRKLRETSITSATADTLNSQSESSARRYYPKEGQELPEQE